MHAHLEQKRETNCASENRGREGAGIPCTHNLRRIGWKLKTRGSCGGVWPPSRDTHRHLFFGKRERERGHARGNAHLHGAISYILRCPITRVDPGTDKAALARAHVWACVWLCERAREREHRLLRCGGLFSWYIASAHAMPFMRAHANMLHDAPFVHIMCYALELGFDFVDFAWWVYEHVHIMHQSGIGFADVLICMHKSLIWIEVGWKAVCFFELWMWIVGIIIIKDLGINAVEGKTFDY